MGNKLVINKKCARKIIILRALCAITYYMIFI